MPRIAGTTDAQSSFLRSFHKSPSGPAPKEWPTIAILRRWLRHPQFLAAFRSIQQTYHAASDFHLSATSSTAAQLLQSTLLQALSQSTSDAPDDPDQIANCKSKIANAITPLRLAHLRRRFPHTTGPADPAPTNSNQPADVPDQRIDTINDPDLRDQNIDALILALRFLSLADPNRPVGDVVASWETRLDSIRPRPTPTALTRSHP